MRAQCDALLILIGEGDNLADHSVEVDHIALFDIELLHVVTDIINGHALGIRIVVLGPGPAEEHLALAQRANAGIVNDGFQFFSSITVLHINSGDVAALADEVDSGTSLFNGAAGFNNRVDRERIHIELHSVFLDVGVLNDLGLALVIHMDDHRGLSLLNHIGGQFDVDLFQRLNLSAFRIEECDVNRLHGGDLTLHSVLHCSDHVVVGDLGDLHGGSLGEGAFLSGHINGHAIVFALEVLCRVGDSGLLLRGFLLRSFFREGFFCRSFFCRCLLRLGSLLSRLLFLCERLLFLRRVRGVNDSLSRSSHFRFSGTVSL